MRGAALIYNGVAMALTKTNSITTRTVMTPDGRDYLWNEVIIDINAVINPQETSYLGVPPVLTPGTLPAVTYQSIRGALSVNRGTLFFVNFNTSMFGGNVGIPVNQISDVNDGPVPLDLRIFQIDGGMTFHVNYKIKFYINDCGNNNPYLSNRFSQEQSIDEHFFTTITTQGEAHFRVDLLDDAGLVADAFRGDLAPFIPFGFRRAACQFHVDSSRNIIRYNFVDIEMPYELGDTGPSGSGPLAGTYITKAEIVYALDSLSTAGPQGGPITVLTGQQRIIASVKLWGSQRASTWIMLQAAFAMCYAKIPNTGDPIPFVIGRHFLQSSTERYVEVTLTFQQGPAAVGPFGNVDVRGMAAGDVLPASTGLHPVPPNDNTTRGTATILMLQSLLTDACQNPDFHQCYAPGGGAPGGDGTPAGAFYCGPPPVVSVTGSQTLPDQPVPYTRPTIDRPYTQGSIQSRYETKVGKTQQPIGASSTSTYVPGGGPPPSSSSAPTCSVGDLFAPMTTRTVDWVAERVGRPPQIPAAYSSDKNQVLLYSNISPMDVAILIDGTPVYTVRGQYRYAWLQDINNTTQLPYDVPQWVDYHYGDNYINIASTGGDLIHGLIDPGDGPTA